MNLCADSQFTDVKLKSISPRKSEQIITMFKNYSFCFPEGIQGKVRHEGSATNSTSDSSLNMYICVNKISISETNVAKNVKTVSRALYPTLRTTPQVSTPSETSGGTQQPGGT